MHRIAMAWWLLVLCAPAASALTWKPVVDPYDQIFPALELATATMEVEPADDPRVLGAPDSLIGAEVVADRPGRRVRLEIVAPRLIRSAVFEGVLAEAGQTYTVYPEIAWDFEALAAVRQPRPEALELRLSVDGGSPQVRVAQVRVRSVNEALYWVGDPARGSVLDFNWLFAAFVNEEHPLIDRILDEALDSGIVERFDGYASGDPEQVYRQVFAIWYVLQRHGIRYSSITGGSGRRDRLLSQRVRFVDQSWENAQANCVDGTVLFASVLRRIELDPQLVLVPGHALLGFALDPERTQLAYLETTLLGARGRRGAGSLQALAAALPEEPVVLDSFAGFEAAVESGQATIDAAGDAFEQADATEYQVVDVERARQAGVMPIVPR